MVELGSSISYLLTLKPKLVEESDVSLDWAILSQMGFES